MSGKSELEQLKEAFFNFDIDRDGFISCEDMKVFLMTKGAKMSREEADEFCNECDFDHDGYIDYQQVAQYLMQGEE